MPPEGGKGLIEKGKQEHRIEQMAQGVAFCFYSSTTCKVSGEVECFYCLSQVVLHMKRLFSMAVNVVGEFSLKIGEALDNILHGGPSLSYRVDFDNLCF